MSKRTTILKPLSRRTLLKGAGAGMALPLLEAMLPTGKSVFASEANSQRFMAYYVPNGMHMASWRPTGTGSDFTLNKTMTPLAEHQNDITVLSNLANHPGTPDGNGAHAGGTGAFLTATKVRKTSGANIQNGISIDQLIAQQTKAHTRFRSLELGLDGGGAAGDCDSGFACAYVRNISWTGPSSPAPKAIDPQQVYARLFNTPYDGLTPDQKAQAIANQQSILDLVKEQTTSLKSKLGSRDNEKLDEYFTQVRALEEKLTNTTQACDAGGAPGTNLDITERVDVMADMIALAFQCDLTRVASYMLGNAGSWRYFGFLGVNDAHHQLSHHQGITANHDKLEIINKWEVERFAYLLNKLKTTQDISGDRLIDNTLVFFASEISDGDWHNHTDMPVILAGNMGGKIKTGEHIEFVEERSFGDLFLTFAQQAGVETDTFGDDGTNTISEILS